MNLREYSSVDGELTEIVADQHVDGYEFHQLAKQKFGVEIKSYNISYMWEQRFMGSERRRALNKLWGSVPITVGIVDNG